MKNQIMLEAEQLQEELTAWRRELHQIPEIGLTLPKTVAFVTKKLDEMDIKYTVYEDSSNIVACIGQGDACYMIRGIWTHFLLRNNPRSPLPPQMAACTPADTICIRQ